MKTLTPATFLVPLAILGLSLALALPATAQPGPMPDSAARHGHGHGKAHNPGQGHSARRMEYLLGQLDLTPAQQLEVQALFGRQHSDRRDLQRSQRERMRQLRGQQRAELAQILSREQMTRLQELRAQARERAHGHGAAGHGKQGRHGPRAGDAPRQRRGATDAGSGR